MVLLQLHKPGSKVTSVSMNPAGGARVVLTAGGREEKCEEKCEGGKCEGRKA